jgi:methionyl-tRNA formyltransferase
MRIAIIGRSELLYETAERLRQSGHDIALVLTAKEAPEYSRTAEDFRAFADAVGCPFIRSARIDDKIEEIRSLEPIDIGVSVNYSGVILQDVIDLFPLGILNGHAGDLPRYRGNACQAWAILNGEERSGLCIHRMIGGELDSGDIIARDFHAIGPATKVTDLWEWMTDRVPVLFEDAVNALAADPAFVGERQSRNPRDALRCYPRRPEDGRIDWRDDAGVVLRLINACNKPYSGAFGDLDGQKLVIWDAEPVDDGENFLAVPGQVTAIGATWIHVATGHGKVQLNQVECEGVTTTPDQLVKSLRTRLG